MGLNAKTSRDEIAHLFGEAGKQRKYDERLKHHNIGDCLSSIRKEQGAKVAHIADLLIHWPRKYWSTT